MKVNLSPWITHQNDLIAIEIYSLAIKICHSKPLVRTTWLKTHHTQSPESFSSLCRIPVWFCYKTGHPSKCWKENNSFINRNYSSMSILSHKKMIIRGCTGSPRLSVSASASSWCAGQADRPRLDRGMSTDQQFLEARRRAVQKGFEALVDLRFDWLMAGLHDMVSNLSLPRLSLAR